MSMYNLVFGLNGAAPGLMAILELHPNNVPRFRDCFLNKDGTEIIIYTRTGGNNRAEYATENAELAAHPRYLGDEDDKFDSTYAVFRFAIDDDYKSLCKQLAEKGYGVEIKDRWENMLKNMR